MKNVLLFVFIGLLVGCTSAEKKYPTSKSKKRRSGYQFKEPYRVVREPKLDPKKVLKKLKIDVNAYGLGLHEKDFNPCKLGLLNSKTSNCSERVLAYVNFQVLCRDSLGTTELVTEYELKPLKNKDLVWMIGNKRGIVSMSRKGYGEILLVSSGSNYDGKLILKNSSLSLGIGLENLRKIVVPKDWCH